MASPVQQLPPGWAAEWDGNNQRYLFIESATGHTQWEPPVSQAQNYAENAPTGSPPVQQHGKRRQYAAGQTQAYYGGGDVGVDPGYLSGGPPQQGGAQLFTPGLVGENQFATQQTQAAPVPGQAPYYAPTTEPEYINAPGFTQQQPVYGQPIDNLSNQFSQMGVGGQKQFQLYTTNLLTSPPDPRDLHLPPPEIRLPPNSCISPSPTANSDPSYQRSTLNAIPTTSSLLGKAKIPLALILTPYRSLKEGDETVPVITDTVIARCRRCRTYINPYVQFIDGGNRWRCCMCNMTNEVPQLFDWDQARNQPGDRWARAELNNSVVEFIAPTEYMVRPPQPAVYIFLIDVSNAAVQSGMVATATRTIKENLDRVPDEDGRTKVAIICFDTSLYFFSLPGTTETSMLVVADIDDVFLPKPNDLLVNLAEAKVSLDSLLDKIGGMFQENIIVGSALGPALQAGFKLMSPIGGKIVVFSSSLPSAGAGSLKNREDPKILGTSKESGLLQAAIPFYKTFAIECSRAQVSVDMFLFSASYQDVATLACLPHYTSGQTYYYPAFNAGRAEDAVKFANELGEVLAMPIMLEAVMRVRASRGLRMSSFHGNFFVRSTDLLAMPAVPQDQSYAIEIQIEETINTPFVVFQTAVLHTTCYGERRIRVVTQALPTTSSLSEVFASADQVAIATFFANKAVERSLTHKLEDARDFISKSLIDILVAYKTSMTSGGAGASAQLAISENLRMLPILVLGLLKNVGIRQSTQIPPDIRAYAQALLTSLPSQMLIPYLHPTFYALHNMPPEAGTIGEHGVILPPPLPLTSERLERHGLYLIEDGQTMFLWVGRDAVPQLVADVFDLPNYETLRGGKTTLRVLENPFSERIVAIIQKIRELRRGPYYPHLYVVKEDGEPPLRLWALSALIQDRADVLPSYQQFISTLKEKILQYPERGFCARLGFILDDHVVAGQQLELTVASMYLPTMISEGEEEPAVVDFDLLEAAKENVQPLASGRRVTALSALLATPHSQREGKLLATRNRLRINVELALDDEDGNPLDAFCRLVYWTVENYPQGHSAESCLLELLEEATRVLKDHHDGIYRGNLKYLKLWLLYASYVDRPTVIYQFLLANDIGANFALLYEEHAAVLERDGRKKEADGIYGLGIARKAQPLDHLKSRYQDFQKRMMTNMSIPVVEPTQPSSQQAPRPALATTATLRSDPSARSLASANSDIPSIPSSSNSRLQIFVDPAGEEAAASSSSGWQELGTRKSRIKENVPETKKLVGSTIKQAGRAKRIASASGMSTSSSSKIVPYRDSDDVPPPPAPVPASKSRSSAATSRTPAKGFAPPVDVPAETPPGAPCPTFTPFRDEDEESSSKVAAVPVGDSVIKVKKSGVQAPEPTSEAEALRKDPLKNYDIYD